MLNVYALYKERKARKRDEALKAAVDLGYDRDEMAKQLDDSDKRQANVNKVVLGIVGTTTLWTALLVAYYYDEKNRSDLTMYLIYIIVAIAIYIGAKCTIKMLNQVGREMDNF